LLLSSLSLNKISTGNVTDPCNYYKVNKLKRYFKASCISLSTAGNLKDPRTFLFGEFEYQADFGWINDLTSPVTCDPVSYLDDITWSAGLEFMIGRDLSLMAGYDNRFGFGGGVVARF
jgi:hypothetical protein